MRKWNELGKFNSGYEIWTKNGFEHFDTLKDAYNYYLDNFAKASEFSYYKECCGKDLRDIADNPRLIVLVFNNVFDEEYHLYEVKTNNSGKARRREM